MTFLDQVKRAVYKALGDLMQAESTGLMRSRTLRENLVVEVDIGGVGQNAKITLKLPFYWAYYAHEGRKEITGKLMIFFPDSRDDPRTGHGTNYPRTVAESKSKEFKLTTAEFKNFRRLNAERAAEGLPPVMVVTKHVGPYEGEFFFKRAWEQLESSGAVAAIIEAGLDKYLEALTDELERSGRP